MNHSYPKIKNEIPKEATHFVSFWWAIVWKEAVAVALGVGAWRLAADWFDGVWWSWVLGALLAWSGFLFLRELFFATLEKRYLRKNFTMLGVDKDGKFSVQKLDQARTLLWSFLWGHLSLILWAVFVCAVVAGGLWLFGDAPFWRVFVGAVLSLSQPGALVLWGAIFAIYPHYHLWSRPFFNLAGFRLAVMRR